MTDDKAIYRVSRVFNDLLKQLHSDPIYEATERHGVIEWAAEIRTPFKASYQTYISLAMWDASAFTTALSSAAALVSDSGSKVVRNFQSDELSNDGAYEELESTAEHLLREAVSAALAGPSAFEGQDSVALYEFASTARRERHDPTPTRFPWIHFRGTKPF
ncbi:MAG TPA: hypothetical protein VGG53_08060 [Mycobacterium sp.]|jgi:hypothetical protein|uniref:hypothetical protein n=1 Tax=Mycobacterium sp. TaxID=1785 RepID=UPI002F426BD8